MLELEPIARRVEAHLQAATGHPARVLAIAPLPGGACQDNLRVEVELPGDELAGPRILVLRSDASSSLPGSLDRAGEARVIRAVVAAGVRTPPARWPGRDLLRAGASAYFLDWVGGVAIGQRVLRAPELAAARARLPEELAAELARIHAITLETCPALAELGGWVRGQGPAEAADSASSGLTFLRQMMAELHEPHPALELVLRWLLRARPPPRPPVLVHGDFRTGNFLVAPGGLTAILDWEFAHLGAAAEDLAWISVRDWRFGELARPAGGLCSREAFLDAYARAGGIPPPRAEIHWWEVFGNARWAAGCVQQGERYLSGAEHDLELLAIGRRAAESEWEALRLIEEGP